MAYILSAQDVWTECIWYHKDMLKEIGCEIPRSLMLLQLKILQIWLHLQRQKGYNVMSAGFVETWCYYDSFFNFVHQQQPGDTPDMVEDAFAGKISWQQPIFKNAMEVFVKLNHAEVWQKDALNMDYQVQAFGDWLEQESPYSCGDRETGLQVP